MFRGSIHGSSTEGVPWENKKNGRKVRSGIRSRTQRSHQLSDRTLKDRPRRVKPARKSVLDRRSTIHQLDQSVTQMLENTDFGVFPSFDFGQQTVLCHHRAHTLCLTIGEQLQVSHFQVPAPITVASSLPEENRTTDYPGLTERKKLKNKTREDSGARESLNRVVWLYILDWRTSMHPPMPTPTPPTLGK